MVEIARVNVGHNTIAQATMLRDFANTAKQTVGGDTDFARLRLKVRDDGTKELVLKGPEKGFIGAFKNLIGWNATRHRQESQAASDFVKSVTLNSSFKSESGKSYFTAAGLMEQHATLSTAADVLKQATTESPKTKFILDGRDRPHEQKASPAASSPEKSLSKEEAYKPTIDRFKEHIEMARDMVKNERAAKSKTPGG